MLIAIGLVATVLAIAGAILPGLPTTPFLLVALWAFSRSSARLHLALMRLPLLRSALAEAVRFEERRAIRAGVKVLALTMAWSSVAVTALLGGRSIVLAVVVAAALGATFTMWWYPTDRV
mgnify:CR=1 FL=1